MGKSTYSFRVADLSASKDTHFKVETNESQRSDIADSLNISAIRKLNFTGKITQSGKEDWKLEAKLGATIVQDCVVTLDPVTTRIDEDILRVYIKNIDEPLIGEIEMPEDDSIDVLPAEIDLFDVMIEALSLSLPPFPRKEGAQLGDAVFSEPGTTPMTDEASRPFASLASLKESLENKDKDGQ